MGDGVADLSPAGPNGPAMARAAEIPTLLRYKFDDIWNADPASTAGTPEALWPYITPHAVHATAPPTAGYWRAGQVVWRETVPVGGAAIGAASAEPLGWVCTDGSAWGGVWANMSSTLCTAAAPTARTITAPAPPQGGATEPEVVALREEVASLRAALRALVGRVASLENEQNA